MAAERQGCENASAALGSVTRECREIADLLMTVADELRTDPGRLAFSHDLGGDFEPFRTIDSTRWPTAAEIADFLRRYRAAQRDAIQSHFRPLPDERRDRENLIKSE